MAEDAGRDPGDPEESMDGTWNGPSADQTDADRSGEGRNVEYHNQEYEDVAVGEDEENSSGNVAGEFRPSRTIEPESPSLENSLFVVFGAYIAILGLTRLFIDSQGFDVRDIAVLTGGTLLVSIVLLGFLGLLTPDT